MFFLFLFGTLVLKETWAGSHSKSYFVTIMSSPELQEPRKVVVGYVDAQQIEYFDSHSANQRVEPRAQWMHKMGQDYWQGQTRIARAETQNYRVGLETLRNYYNQSKGGVHVFQTLIGCEISSDGSFKRGILQHAYDGLDYISLDMETYTWTAAVPVALITKRKWESDGKFLKRGKAYLEEECVQWLHKHLEDGKDSLLRTDPPAAQVTHHAGSKGEVILQCRAQGFYPSEISLAWLRDGEEQLQDTEFIETRPAGDGTFQKWAAVSLTSGQEEEYICQIQHEGLPEPLTLKWEPQTSSIWICGGIIAIALLIAVVAGVVIWRKQNSDGKEGNYIQTADNDSTQGSDVSFI